MYSVKALLDKNPVTISAAVKATLSCLVLFAVINWTAAQVAGVLVALELILGLFVQARTVNRSKLDELESGTSEIVRSAVAEVRSASPAKSARQGRRTRDLT